MKTPSVKLRFQSSHKPHPAAKVVQRTFDGGRLRCGGQRNRVRLTPGVTLLLLTPLVLALHSNHVVAQSTEDRPSLKNPAPVEFPYRAKVKSPTADVYSGPGKVHYPTGQLKEGESVEVYRLDPGGWCAIRPPSGSFSLVPATAIEEVDDSIGEIVEPEVQAWVGTELGPVEVPLWQVKLKLGEKVELLGVVHWPDPEGFSSSWYQIAAPAGEFRWVRQDDIFVPPALARSQPSYHQFNDSADSQNQVERQVSSISAKDDRLEAPTEAEWTTPGGSIARVGFESELVDSMEQENSRSTNHQQDYRGRQSDAANNPGGSTVGWRRATRPIHQMEWDQPPASNESQGFSSVGGFRDSTNYQPPDRMASSRLDSRFQLEQLVPNNSMPVGQMTNRLTELELRLNKEMLKEPNQWRLHDIREATQKIIDSTQDTLEQMQAQQFLAKLENCRRIRDNSVKLSAAPISIRGGSLGSGVADQNSVSFDQDFSLATRYDAYGRLNQLIREGGKREATYVLQDENGKITHHVSPGPGMSLTSYVGKRVGIIGQRGYHTRLKLDHVTAANVVELR